MPSSGATNWFKLRMHESNTREQIRLYEQEIETAGSEYERVLRNSESYPEYASLKVEAKEKYEKKVAAIRERIGALERRIFEHRIDRQMADSSKPTFVTTLSNYNAGRNYGSDYQDY